MNKRKQVALIYSNGEGMPVYADGTISRANGSPSGEWKLLGAVRFNNFGHVAQRYSFDDVVAGRVDKWTFRNGKQRVHICDLDHGTKRVWMLPNHSVGTR